MAVLLEGTKIARVNKAFHELAGEYIASDDTKSARRIIEALDGLPTASKARLFDILTNG